MKTITLPNRKLATTALFALTLLTGVYAHASPATITPGAWISAGSESESDFKCPDNQVMTGRKHNGDENAETSYKCGKSSQAGELTTAKHKEYAPISEKNSRFTCDKDTVMTGRKHEGDEYGQTTYTCAEVVDSAGRTLQVTNDKMHGPYKESAHEFECPANQTITGRDHEGDENGNTSYMCAHLQ